MKTPHEQMTVGEFTATWGRCAVGYTAVAAFVGAVVALAYGIGAGIGLFALILGIAILPLLIVAVLNGIMVCLIAVACVIVFFIGAIWMGFDMLRDWVQS